MVHSKHITMCFPNVKSQQSMSRTEVGTHGFWIATDGNRRGDMGCHCVSDEQERVREVSNHKTRLAMIPGKGSFALLCRKPRRNRLTSLQTL